MSASSAPTFKAFGIFQYGPTSEVVQEVTLEKKQPQGRDLLVKIYAGAFNPVDFKVIKGSKSTGPVASPPRIAGYDGAGIVEAVGPEATEFKVGDAVYFAGVITRNGTFAEYTLVDERIVARKPKTLDWVQAAAVPLVALTAWEGLVDRLRISVPQDAVQSKANAAKTLLFVGGSGGVGSFGIQIAKRVLNLTVIATASRPETIKYCKDLGADHVIGHGTDKPFADELKALGMAGVDYVFNTDAPTPRFAQFAQIVKPSGAIVNIQGTGGQQVDIGLLMDKRISLHYEFMFSRPLHNDAPEEQRKILTRVAELIDEGVLKHTLSKTFHFTLDGIKQGLEYQQSGKALGKSGFAVVQSS